MNNRRDSLQQLTEQVNALIACLRSINTPSIMVYTLWSAKDVLCHITFWHESFARNLRAVANHDHPSPLKGSLETLNQQGVDELRPLSVDSLIDRLLAAHAAIECHILDPSIGLIPYRKGSRSYTPEEHLEIVRVHLRKHIADIYSAIHGTKISSGPSAYSGKPIPE